MAWVTPTGFEDPDSAWTDEAKAYNDDTSDYAYETDIPGTSWSSYLVLTIGSITCNEVRVYASGEHADITQIDIDAYYKDAWHDVYEGVFAQSTWLYKSLGMTETVTKMRVRLYNSDGVNRYDGRVHDADFWRGGITVVKRRVKLTPWRLLEPEAARTTTDLVYPAYR